MSRQEYSGVSPFPSIIYDRLLLGTPHPPNTKIIIKELERLLNIIDEQNLQLYNLSGQ